jgi:hypothetical protein
VIDSAVDFLRSDQLWNFIRAYQTLVVGLLGFAGVILTLLVNAYLQRAQDRRRAKQEARGLRIALMEELRVQRMVLEEVVESLDTAENENGDAGGRFGLVPLERYSRVFDRSIDKLGLLTGRELAYVFAAYLPLSAMTWKLKAMEPATEHRDPTGDIARITPQHFDAVKKMHRNSLLAIDAAMRELRHRI